ncbi:MAG TPA: APC family permease [Stellaceae bacterium]|nr:APC family permease [Stellaceae bacterium]
MQLLRLLLGRTLANREQAKEKIGVLTGVPAMGLDALSSSAYGPEAALTMLMPLGAAGLGYIGPITLVLLGLLAILFVSYRQTIAAYPSGGGSFTVAKENLGTNAGLLAATALMIDYVLNVAVGISAGTAALVSAVPVLQPYLLELCLAILLLITFVNLRGASEAGLVFAIPTYLFIACFFAVLALGLAKAAASAGHPAPVAAPAPLPGATATISLWLLLRAFASGCTAMTGVEAVSNGVGAFREPAVPHARRTLAAIVSILALLLAGIAYLAQAYAIGAMDQSRPGYQSVLSQLVGAVVGRGWFYYVAIASLLAVLSLSANTSFNGFPRLCRLVAQDDFLPRGFAAVGRRLVYSVGILYLAGAAGLLLLVFGGITDRLIPLFAVGAFLAFTLSQTGMVVHWRRALRGATKRRDDHIRLAVNAVGGGITAAALVVILAAKFREGAWITVLAIPCTLILLKTVKRYYLRLERQIRKSGPLDLRRTPPPVIVIPTEEWNRLAEKALYFALSLSSEVIAVHLTKLGGPDVEEKQNAMRRSWIVEVEKPARAAGLNPPRLVLLPSPYRRFFEPLLRFIKEVGERHRDRCVAVLIPQLVKQHWWEHLLHTQRARRLRAALLRHGGPKLIVISVPWYLEAPSLDDGLEGAEAPEEMAANIAARL